MARDIERRLASLREAESFKYLIEKGMILHEIDTTDFQKKSVQVQNKLARELGATDLLELIRAAKQL